MAPITSTLPQISCPQNVTREVIDPDQSEEIRYKMYQSGKIVENVILMKPGETVYKVPISPTEWCYLHVLITGEALKPTCSL